MIIESADLRLMMLMDLVPDPVIAVDEQEKIVAANKFFEKFSGFMKEQIIGKKFSDLGLVSVGYKRLLGAGLFVEPYEIRMESKNGQAEYFEVKGHRIEHEGQLLDIAIFHEITKLKNSEEKFRGIANVNKDAIVLVNERSRITFWNPAAEKIFGYSSQEAIGKDVHKLVVPKTLCKEGKERIKTSVDIFSETGAGYFTVGNVQLVGKRKDGSEFPAELSLSPVKLGGNWDAVGVVKDTTDRKKAEELLREAEQRYHVLFDQAPIGVLIVNPETAGFVEFNDLAHGQLGYSREEFEKLSISDIEARESKAEVLLHLSEMVKAGGGEFETTHRTRDGKIKNILVITRVIRLADRRLLHCILHDITDIRQVQDALSESETRYRQLVELAQEGVWVLDKTQVTTFVNPRMAQMLGYDRGEMVGKSGLDFVDEASVDAAKDILNKYAQGISGESELEFLRKDGSRVYTSISASQIKDDQGHYWGTLALVADITARKEMADKLEKYSKHLEELVEKRTKELADTQAQLIKSERLAAIGELAGMVGHDLRNPLTGIKNAAYFLNRKNAFPSSQGKQMLDVIDKCVDHSNKIINDLLDYSREIRLEKEEASPQHLVLDALAILSIPQKIHVVIQVANKPSINVDVEKVTRVFINLIKNAIDSMPDGGTITVSSLETKDNLKISVSDTGIGIPEEVLPKLFSPLVTTKAQGMGFGLAICKRIIEAHGGTITVKTVKNQGTTFALTLPIESDFESGR